MATWVEGCVLAKKCWKKGLYSLEIDAVIAPFKAGQFTRLALEIDGQRIARPYSFVNPPQQLPLEVYFNEITGGPLSPHLAKLEPGHSVWVAVEPNGFFTLDELPTAQNLWLIATGTGLGVYLSLLRTPALWEQFQKVVLVHGVREPEELAYAELIQALLIQYAGRLQFVPVTSQTSTVYTLKGRVTEVLQDGRLEQHVGLTLTPENSHIMLCGNPNMIHDMSVLLHARAMRPHRRREPGHYTVEKYR